MSIFFISNQDQKKFIKRKIKKYYPDFKSGGYFYKKFIKSLIHRDSIILDAGCGENGFIKNFQHKAKLIIGIDIDQKSLKNNKIVQKKILADLESIPLRDNLADMVLAEFVLEHLKNPQTVIKEISRILKPGGSFIFITPNIINPVMFLSKILPYKSHEFLLKNLLKKKIKPHRTYYRANTLTKLKILAKKSDLKKIKIVRAGNSEYLGFCKPLVIPSIFLERLFSKKPLNIFQIYLAGVFKKKFN